MLEGGHDGQLAITAVAAGGVRYRSVLSAADFRCGADSLAIDGGGEPWGGGVAALPLLATGWSDSNSLLWLGPDGSLRIRKLRRNAGVVLGIPMRADEDFQARFRRADAGCTPRQAAED